MFSARFEDALEHATDEELFSFFSEVPSVFRRRLIAVLSELESHEAQHFINTTLPEEPDSDDLVWPSDPEGQQITSEPDSSSPESWGIFGKPVRPAPGALFGGSEDPPPPRPQPAPRLPVPRLQQTPQPAPVPQQPAASSSAPSRACNHCDSGPAWADAAFAVCSSACLLLQLRGFPMFRPSRLFPHMPARSPLCLRRRLSSILRLGSDSVRGILAAMALADATPTASSVTGNVTIPPARLSVRGRMTL